MTPVDLVALGILAALALVSLLALRALWRGNAFYSRRRRLGRLGVLVGSLVVLFVLLTWLPVLVLRFVPPPTSAFMLQRAVPCRGYHYRWVPWKRISHHVPIAFVAAEDQHFPDHHGFDVEAIRKVMDAAGDRGPRRGASTISQQVAKNLFLWRGHSWTRKALEAWWTVLLETTWPKRRILEVYVNVAQLGTCTFGVGAAARQYFDKEPRALGPSEAALLAAVLPAPDRFRVARPSGYVRRREAWIARQVRQLGGADYLER